MFCSPVAFFSLNFIQGNTDLLGINELTETVSKDEGSVHVRTSKTQAWLIKQAEYPYEEKKLLTFFLNNVLAGHN